ncbi:hypothetical protein [Micromonospora sp. CV4]|uniref:hypothetical protein n=1 Tax=Micromonospora sp. CV4 TaxID=2478711 RepID=UPI000EF51E15|nr:hypothetical protein [Micromonospora sp. CV4]RLP93460.1 hypothetical protein EAD98_19025 [Micromonospora sp. CV4]
MTSDNLIDGERFMGDPLDDIAELEELRHQAQDLARRFAAGEREAAEVSARDSHEVVRVVLAADGRISEATVFFHWHRRISSDQLGAAIVEAADEAARLRIEAWSHGISQATGNEPDAPGPATSPSGSGLTEPGDESAVNFARGLFHVLTDSFARLDDLAAEAERAALTTSTSADPEDRARVTLSGERLSAVVIDEAWLRSAHADQVGAAVTQALQQAYADRKQASPLRNSWPYDELERMTGDPAQLLANLGLAPRQARRSD